MRTRVSERIAQARNQGVDLLAGPEMAFVPLGLYADPRVLEALRPCDRCNRLVPMGERWHPIRFRVNTYCAFSGGLCHECWDREVVPTR